jgi:tRNA (guanine-N7-)-methyltransferase
MSNEESVRGRARRMSIGGKLSFRRRVPAVAAAGLPLVDGGDDPPALERLVPDGFAALDVEIGPGKGGFLAAASQASPERFFVGIEAAPGYASLAALRIRELGAENCVVLIDNGTQFLRDRTPDESIDRLHVYFPDPWPKRRHRRRRFFHEGVPSVLERVLEPDGLVLVSTDNAAYAGQICRVLGAHSGLCRDERAEADLLALGPGHAFTPTHFERKYLAEGRVIRRYAFRKSTR